MLDKLKILNISHKSESINLVSLDKELFLF